MSDDWGAITDPWGATPGNESALVDPWDKAREEQTRTMVPTDQLPATKIPAPVIAQANAQAIPIVNDLMPWRGATPAQNVQAPPAQSAPSAEPAKTSVSTYLILGGIVSVLGYFGWRLYQKEKNGSLSEAPVEGLDELVSVETFALPINDKQYVVVEEIEKKGKKTKVRFPYSDARIWIDPEDLLSEKAAKKQGLEEHT